MSGRVSVVLGLAAMVAAGSASAREVVPFGDASAGTIVVSVSQRKLYLVNGDGTAIRYPVAVGKPGSNGSARRGSTASTSPRPGRPLWEVKRDNPRLPNVIAGGSPHNPMGAAAMTLAGGNTPFTARTVPAPSAPGRPMAASACTIRTWSISTSGSMSVRPC